MGKIVGNYEISTKLGAGAFATVFAAVHVVTKEKMAIKVIPKQKLSPKKLQENLEKEIQILRTLSHPNVVKLFEILTSENHIYLVLEFCGGGDLATYIKSNGKCPEETARYFISQLAAGLQFMRSNSVVHRDLKPQNLLLTSSQPPVLKIADFGFARSIEEGNLAETLCGSPLYMAPEVLNYQKYDARVDLWAVGAILFELLTATPPFPARNQTELVNKIKRFDIAMPTHISEDCRALLVGLLTPDPVKRMSYEAFFASPFLDQSILNSPSNPIPPQMQAPAFQPQPEVQQDDADQQRVVKFPKINPFKSPQQSTDDDTILSPTFFSQFDLQSSLFSFASVFPSVPAEDLAEFRRLCPAIECLTRTAVLLCDLADIQAQSRGFHCQAFAIALKGLDLLSVVLQKLHAVVKSAPGPVRALATELRDLLQVRTTNMLHRADDWAAFATQTAFGQACSPDKLDAVETILFQHAITMAREAAVDELLGHLDTSFQRYEIAFVLMDYLAGLVKDESDRVVLGDYAASCKERRKEIIRQRKDRTA